MFLRVRPHLGKVKAHAGCLVDDGPCCCGDGPVATICATAVFSSLIKANICFDIAQLIKVYREWNFVCVFFLARRLYIFGTVCVCVRARTIACQNKINVAHERMNVMRWFFEVASRSFKCCLLISLLSFKEIVTLTTTKFSLIKK